MSKFHDIPGGIHPPENKSQSLGRPIGSLPLPDQLILPLNQHIGPPARTVVAEGDRVLQGQMLAEPTGAVSAPVHAPTSGTIERIGDHQVPHPSGMTTTCLVLRPDGENRRVEYRGVPDYLEAEPGALLEHIRQCGIAGLGGAGFPAAVKLGPRQPIDTLVVNGSECEPYITADDILMQERAADIVEGIRIAAHILGEPETVLVGVEDNKPRACAALRAAVEGTRIQVVEFPTKYPSGGEKQLIQILTGREVPSGKLPADIGVVCQNTGTLYAICRAVRDGEPLTSRITTVTGRACTTNRNYEVLLGTPVRHLLEHNGFDDERCTRLVMGGPMMGFTLPTPDVPVIKTTNCILACDASESPPPEPQQPCIRCGMCAEVCPASLLPQQLFWYSQSHNHERLENLNLFDCIECGACAYVCPSNIPLVQYYRAAKGEIRKQEAEKQKADHARQRFEFHKARIERAEAEKAARREARRKKAKAKSTAGDGGEAPSDTPSGTDSATDLIAAARARSADRQASPDEQRSRLERKLESAKSRLQAATGKLHEAQAGDADSEQVEKLRARVKAENLKVQQAYQRLQDFHDEEAVNAAARRVKEKLQASPRQLLEEKINALRARIAETEQQLAHSAAVTELERPPEEAHPEHYLRDDSLAIWDEGGKEPLPDTGGRALQEALHQTLDKQREKLREAEQQLAELGTSGSEATATDDATGDAAAAAIARARAKAQERETLSPAEKLDAAIESLHGRIEKARSRLETARAEGADHVDALESGLEKLEAKLADTREQRRQLDQREDD